MKTCIQIKDEGACLSCGGGGDFEGDQGGDIRVSLGADAFVDLAGCETVSYGSGVYVVS